MQSVHISFEINFKISVSHFKNMMKTIKPHSFFFLTLTKVLKKKEQEHQTNDGRDGCNQEREINLFDSKEKDWCENTL